MANIRNGNSYYIDTQFSTNEELVTSNAKVPYIVVTATGASAVVVLSDSSKATKCDLRVATSGTTQVFDFRDYPIVFSTSIRPTTLTNAKVTVVLINTAA